MKIAIANLTEQNLRDTPEWEAPPFSCRYCVYWEFPEECVDPTGENQDSTMRRKADWLRRTSDLFGQCGKIAYVDGVAVGYAQYAPPEFFPNTLGYAAGPASPSAVFISCLFIPQNQFRRLGLGSELLNAILDELRQRGFRAVETFGRKGRADNPSGPVEFYLRHGFRIYRDDAEFPLLHLVL